MEMGIYVFTIEFYDGRTDEEYEKIDKALQQGNSHQLHFGYSSGGINDAEFIIATDNPNLICQCLEKLLDKRDFYYTQIWGE